MTTDPRADVVVDQYQRWRYPEPIEDLPAWLANNWQWFDPSHSSPLMWPDRGYTSGLRILIAGCGTNQAAVIAYTNPGATVVAIDVSQPSLDHEELLKQRYGLRNLELHLLPIEEVGTLGQEFDLIMSTGVLHHLVDPQAGMNALASVLGPDGVMALMLYARNGRIGVEMMEAVFADMGLVQDEASVALVKQAIAILPAEHPLRSYLNIAPDLDFDAGLVDTFLHGRERSYTVDDCLALVDESGLVFQDWLLKSSYEPIPMAGNDFLDAVAQLPDRQRWSVMERINTVNGCHFFLACRPDRQLGDYRIDFTSDTARDYVPMFRYRCWLDADAVVRPGWRIPLTLAQASIASKIDGERSISEVARLAGVDVDVVTGFVQSLWQRDVFAVGVPASA